ncbi:MAG: nucleotidyltransferase family protein [Planctomycetaceae bacterium]|nr:nucleotidyltransferase family protein [Planctomycetaceae bacterium]
MNTYGDISLDRMVRAVEKVRERLIKVTTLLNAANIPYALVGGNAVAAWVSRVDEAAVRNTRDVDILIRRSDLNQVIQVLEQADFVFRHAAGIDMFLDGPEAKARDAVYLVYAEEKVRQDYLLPTPAVSESEWSEQIRILSLEALVRMKLTSFRDKDKTHLRDFLELGLLDESWVGRYPKELGTRLQQLIDDPDG